MLAVVSSLRVNEANMGSSKNVYEALFLAAKTCLSVNYLPGNLM